MAGPGAAGAGAGGETSSGHSVSPTNTAATWARRSQSRAASAYSCARPATVDAVPIAEILERHRRPRRGRGDALAPHEPGDVGPDDLDVRARDGGRRRALRLQRRDQRRSPHRDRQARLHHRPLYAKRRHFGSARAWLRPGRRLPRRARPFFF